MRFSQLLLSLRLVDLLKPESHQLNSYDFTFFSGVRQALVVLGLFEFVLLGEALVLLNHFVDDVGRIETDPTNLLLFFIPFHLVETAAPILELIWFTGF